MKPTSRRRGPITIITVEMAGAGPFAVEYFYQTIQAAALIGSSEARDVEVIFLPDALGRQTLRRAVRRLARRARPARARAAGGRSLHARFSEDGEVEIRRPWGRIRLVRRRPAATEWIGNLGRSLAGAVGVWRRSFEGGRFVPAAFLRASFRGAAVGDLAASTFHRSRFSTGTVPPHPFLFYILWKACQLIETARAVVPDRDIESSVAMTPELTYYWAAPFRHLVVRGALAAWQEAPAAAIAIRRSDGKGEVLRVWETSDGRGEALRVRETSDGAPGPDDAIAEYMHRRLHSPRRLLWYPDDFQSNDNSAHALVDSHGHAVALPADGAVAVVFLHSFGDAQYFYGVDDFAGLEEWTFHTIRGCLRNPRLARLLIKPHPYAGYANFPADQRELGKVTEAFGDDPRVTILDPRSSLVALASHPNVVGLTHHGSVAEEFVYLGRPVIASAVAPWGDRHPFVRTWSTVAEYDRLLGSIDAHAHTAPTEEERAALHQYIRTYRLSELSSADRLPSLILASLEAGGVTVPFDQPSQERYWSRLEALEPGDPHFDALMDAFEALPISVDASTC